MGSQQFCLRWNNHQTNMLSVFDKLLTKEAFVDVTIACEGSSIKAHKMVLSACSPFFEDLFFENPCKHPIVILRDMRHSDLKAIIDFMYKGEINVSQDRLSGLLKTAECLKVKGLAEVTHEEQNNGSKPSDFGVRGSVEHPSSSSFTPQTPVVNHVSQSNKRKSKIPKNNSDYQVESNCNQPPTKKRPESPKISDSMRVKQASSPKLCDLNDSIMPVSADTQPASMPHMSSSTITSQPIHPSPVQTPTHLPSNLPMVMPVERSVKLESPSPPPEIISSEPIIHHDSNSTQEFILEPETVMEQGMMNKNDESYQEKEQGEHHSFGTDISMAIEQSQDAGPSQDPSIIYPDGANNNGVNQAISPLGKYQFRTRHIKSWSEEDMRQAITMITAGGWDIRRTAETYNIPLRTLYYHLKKARKDKNSVVRPSDLCFVQPEV